MADDETVPDPKSTVSTSRSEPIDVDVQTETDTPAQVETIAAEHDSSTIELDETGPATAGQTEDDGEEKAAKPPKKRMSHVRLAVIAGLVVVVALAGLTGWSGFRAYKAYQGEKQRELFLQVGRQGAINLTTIDWEHADQDVQRVLDSATGTFYDDFQNRSAPFVEVVKQAQSKSVGTISEAGLESASGDEAKVLVAVSVNTSNLGASQQEPRAWRMRLTVTKVGDDAKVSNVEFVP